MTATVAAKLIVDLDLLIRALLSSLPASKAWQRQLRLQLDEADRLLQVLRMTVSMERESSEIMDAAGELVKALRLTDAYVKSGRADLGTKQAIQLGFSLAQRVFAAVASINAESAGPAVAPPSAGE